MYKLKIDTNKNRLSLSLIGTISLEEAKKIRQTIESSLVQLSPGFNVVNDISKMIHADDASGIVLKEIIILLVQHGVKKVVRIVGPSKTALLQFANNSLQLEQYKISYVPSIEEAENLLNEVEN